jgi:hypothetical protein
VRGLDQQAALERLSLLADVAGLHRSFAGLADARIEPEVADELASAGEAGDLADHTCEREGGDCTDTRNGHQSPHVRARECPLGERALRRGDLAGDGVVEAQRAPQLRLLVLRELGQQAPASFPKRSVTATATRLSASTACNWLRSRVR